MGEDALGEETAVQNSQATEASNRAQIASRWDALFILDLLLRVVETRTLSSVAAVS